MHSWHESFCVSHWLIGELIGSSEKTGMAVNYYAWVYSIPSTARQPVIPYAYFISLMIIGPQRTSFRHDSWIYSSPFYSNFTKLSLKNFEEKDSNIQNQKLTEAIPILIRLKMINWMKMTRRIRIKMSCKGCGPSLPSIILIIFFDKKI